MSSRIFVDKRAERLVPSLTPLGLGFSSPHILSAKVEKAKKLLPHPIPEDIVTFSFLSLSGQRVCRVVDESLPLAAPMSCAYPDPT